MLGSTASAGRVSTRRSLSLQWKLPLLMIAVFAAGLAALLTVTYATLVSRAEAVVRDRLSHAGREVATSAASSANQHAETMRAAARDYAIHRVLWASRTGDLKATAMTPARQVLATLMSRTDSLPVELWDARQHVVLAVGRTLTGELRPPAPNASDALDSVRYSPMQPIGDHVRFWAFAPVRSDGRITGWIAHARMVSGAPDAARALREMLREDVSLYLRDASAGVWVSAPGRPASPPLHYVYSTSHLAYERPGVGAIMAEEAPIIGTPWVMVLESPRSWLLERPRPTLVLLGWLSLALILVGAALSWALSHRITRPLVALTLAAEEVAGGTPGPRDGRAGDEIARLAASFEEMARRVGSARRELETRAAEAESGNRAKSDFLAMMSHELRTPLNAIGGYAELLDLGIYGPVNEAQRDALARIGRSQDHLLTLINDVLSFARIDAGQLTYTLDDVPLHQTLAGLEALVAPQVRARHLAFDYQPCDADVVVRADRDKLNQVMLNLIGNGIKYNHDGGSVTIACDVGEVDVRVHVRDTGAGIPADRLQRIFDPFVQGERALNRPGEGVGLGLAISRELARGMGAELTVTSELGTGSTFTMVVPRVARVAAEEDALVLDGERQLL